jgi:hypothetical protein
MSRLGGVGFNVAKACSDKLADAQTGPIREIRNEAQSNAAAATIII